MNLEKFNSSKFLKTPMSSYIHRVFLNSFSKNWYYTYFVFDLHNTIIKSTYDQKDNTVEYYPYAKKAMQQISKRDDIVKILWSSSSDEQLEKYNKIFISDDIIFQKFNENPDINSKNGNFGSYDKKFYFNCLIDDKAGFLPNEEWYYILELFKEYERLNILPDKNWIKK